jgi:small-conductance mechanosensitive channel
MNYIKIFNGIIIILITVLISWIAKYLLSKIEQFTNKTKSNLDDAIIKGVTLPLQLVIVLAGVYIATKYLISDLVLRGFDLNKMFFSIFIFLLAYASVRIMTTVFNWYQDDIAQKTQTDIDDAFLPIIKKIISIILYTLAGLMILDKLEINISPILASLGIAGLAVGLALQDTLSNFFSAVYLTIDRPIKVGDYIDIESSTKGYVVGIGWRSTKIRTLSGNNIIFPNSKLSQSVITNYEGPDPQVSLIVEAGVSYDSDLDKVEKVAIQAAKEVLNKNEGGVSDYEPLFRLAALNESSIDFKVILKAKSYVDQFKLKHDFVSELVKKFREENINIPFPQHDIHLIKEGE